MFAFYGNIAGEIWSAGLQNLNAAAGHLLLVFFKVIECGLAPALNLPELRVHAAAAELLPVQDLEGIHR